MMSLTIVVPLFVLTRVACRKMFGGFAGGGGFGGFGGGPGGGGGMPGGPGAFDKTYKVFPSSFYAATKNTTDPEAYESSDKSEQPFCRHESEISSHCIFAWLTAPQRL